VAQLARARRSGRRGRPFKSGHPDFKNKFDRIIKMIYTIIQWRETLRVSLSAFKGVNIRAEKL